MMQDPTKKWTQRNLREMSRDARGTNYDKSENFVDDMMRLKDYVFKAQSIQKTIHHYAIGNDTIDNRTYDYISDLKSQFRSICSSTSMQYIRYMIDDIFDLKLGKTKTERMLASLRSTEKFIEQLKHSPQYDKDIKSIGKKYILGKHK